eukprot:8133619-Prorocentrum_lima.AAC.1
MPPVSRNVLGVSCIASAMMCRSLGPWTQLGSRTNRRTALLVTVLCKMTRTCQSGGRVSFRCIQMVAGSSNNGICKSSLQYHGMVVFGLD